MLVETRALDPWPDRLAGRRPEGHRARPGHAPIGRRGAARPPLDGGQRQRFRMRSVAGSVTWDALLEAMASDDRGRAPGSSGRQPHGLEDRDILRRRSGSRIPGAVELGVSSTTSSVTWRMSPCRGRIAPLRHRRIADWLQARVGGGRRGGRRASVRTGLGARSPLLARGPRPRRGATRQPVAAPLGRRGLRPAATVGRGALRAWPGHRRHRSASRRRRRAGVAAHRARRRPRQSSGAHREADRGSRARARSRGHDRADRHPRLRAAGARPSPKQPRRGRSRAERSSNAPLVVFEASRRAGVGAARAYHRLAEAQRFDDFAGELQSYRRAFALYGRDRPERELVAVDLGLPADGGRWARGARLARLGRPGWSPAVGTNGASPPCVARPPTRPGIGAIWTAALGAALEARPSAAEAGDRWVEVDSLLIEALVRTSADRPAEAEPRIADLLRIADSAGARHLRALVLAAGAAVSDERPADRVRPCGGWPRPDAS